MTDRAKALRAVCAAAKERIVLTGHDGADVDSVISCLLMRRLLTAWGIASEISLPMGADRQSARVLAEFGIDTALLTGDIAPLDCVILLDHHEPLHGGRVLACIDHHPTDAPPACSYVQIEPRGACALQVFDLMREAGMEIEAMDEKLAVTALWLDTVALRSAKISRAEADWGRERADALHLDTAMLEREGLGLADLSQNPQTLARLYQKTQTLSGRRVCSSTIQTDRMTEALLEKILTVLRRAVREEGAALWVYLVNNPIAMRTLRLDVRPDGSVKKIHYGFLASRGKTVMPDVERMMAEESRKTKGETDGGHGCGAGTGAL